jgi:hypothetical protein
VKERARLGPLDSRKARRFRDRLRDDRENRGADRDRRARRKIGLADRRLVANERRALRQRAHPEAAHDELHVEVAPGNGQIAQHQVRVPRPADDS